ncbi:MAG: prepilin-type N-terminal cleavage/methylation domain-containing protein [Verrucomicrobiota bacterium]
MHFQKRFFSRAGFSLVEVLVALVVIAVAFIPITGLIPLGLRNVQVSAEETHAVHILTAVIQDMKYARSSDLHSTIFKISQLPFNGAQQNAVNRIWIDSSWNTYPSEKRPNTMCYEVEWEYTSVPPATSLLPVEATITVRWPPPVHAKQNYNISGKGGEITVLASFRKP